MEKNALQTIRLDDELQEAIDAQCDYILGIRYVHIVCHHIDTRLDEWHRLGPRKMMTSWLWLDFSDGNIPSLLRNCSSAHFLFVKFTLRCKTLYNSNNY